MAELFAFRPAPLRRPQEWRLDGDTLEGPAGRYDLSRVDRAGFVDMRMGRMRNRRLDLAGPQGSCRIALNCRTSVPPADPDRAAHRALCKAVAETLAARDPQLPVSAGESRGWRLAWFVIGLLSLLGGLGIGAGALASGLDVDRLAGAAVPVGLLVLLGASLAWGYHPWRAQPSTPVEDLPGTLDNLDPITPSQR